MLRDSLPKQMLKHKCLFLLIAALERNGCHKNEAFVKSFVQTLQTPRLFIHLAKHKQPTSAETSQNYREKAVC